MNVVYQKSKSRRRVEIGDGFFTCRHGTQAARQPIDLCWPIMGWHLSYNPTAEVDMMQTIVSALKTKKFVKGIESRVTTWPH